MGLTTTQKRIALGLCPACGSPRDNETTRCAKCRALHAEQSKLRQQQVALARRAAGQCVQCGKPSGSEYRCPTCTEKHAVSSRRDAARKLEERRVAGRCLQCGGVRDNDTTRCSKCREEHNAGTAAANLRATAERERDGVCTVCGGPRDQFTKICSSCLSAAAARNYKSRSVARGRKGVCRRCNKPVWSDHTAQCRYHFTYGILHNFMPRVDPGLVELMAAKLEQQGFKCALTDLPITPGQNASLDHVLPKSRYPELESEPTNFVWVDCAANNMKRDVTPDDPLFDSMLAPAVASRIRDLASQVVRPAQAPTIPAP